MEYKFRGKSKRTDEWVYGSYHFCNQKGIMRTRKWGTVMDIIEEEVQFNSHWILVHQTPGSPGWDIRETFIPHEVYPETVGQYTGLKDKNEVEIYGGDILKSFSPSVPSYEVFYYKSSYRLRYKLKCGEWYDWGPLFRMEEIQWEGRLPLCPDVIGNIHDNLELLNPPKEGVLNMNTDPNNKPEGEVKEEVPAQPAEQATEESAEEGTTEG